MIKSEIILISGGLDYKTHILNLPENWEFAIYE